LASGHAYQRAGALALARDRYSALLTSPMVETRARAALGLHRLGDPAAAAEPSGTAQLLDVIDADLAGASDIALRAEVMAARSRSHAHLLADDRSQAVPMAAEALRLARSTGEDATLASCLLAYHDAIWEPGTEEKRQATADELAVIGHRLADPVIEAQGLLLRMVAEIERGDPTYLTTHRLFDATARASRSPRLQYVAASRRGMIAALRADLPAALVEIDAARAVGARIGEPDAIGMWCDQRWQVARHSGDTETIIEVSATLREHGDPHWVLFEAMLGADTGDLDRVQRYGPDVDALGRRWPRWAARLWDTFSALLAILENDHARIAAMIARMERDADHWAVLGGGVLVDGPLTAWLGRLEAARENWERAELWSSRAEEAARRLDAQLWLAEARADRLAAQHAAGTVEPAELAGTIAAARERGLTPIVERLQALQSATPTQSANAFRRERDVWTLVFEGVEARMPDAKGLRDLHTLLANPRVDIPAGALATDRSVNADITPVLDARAKQAYRRRLDELDGELDRAALRGDSTRAENLERERQSLLDELRRAAGLGGRDRAINDERERMRKTVTARIRDALRRIDDRHPALAAHLRASVHTGAVCGYIPADPVNWDLGS
jgi:hypothetical protein